jgi:hypothetical protein
LDWVVYTADVDIAIARKSIAAVGQIALETPDAEAIVMRLLQFLEVSAYWLGNIQGTYARNLPSV